MRASIACLLLCLSLVAQASSTVAATTASSLSAPSTSTPPSSSTGPSYSQDQLNRFAQADKAVQQVRARYLAVFLQDHKDGRDSKMTQTAMQIDMAKAVKDAGLSLDDYNRMAHAMAGNEALRLRIEKME